MRNAALVMSLAFLLPGIVVPDGAADEITVGTLLEEMVDRDRLARVPSPAYVCRQFSSYDRESVAPEATDTWFANADRTQFIRAEENGGRTEHVLFDADGPGAVVRFWATWHGPGGGAFSNGTLRVYFDGNAEPAIAAPIADVLDGGYLSGPPLGQSVSPLTPYAHRGHNLYFPIPYARHCKITYETDVLIDRGARKGEALYYQINYRTYEPGTNVRTFAMGQLEDVSLLLSRVQRRLCLSGAAQEGPRMPDTPYRRVPLNPGEKASYEMRGSLALRELSLRVAADDLPQALRSTVLVLEFDGEPCVWCPVGDFFGTGYYLTPYRTWYTQVTPDGSMTCYWVMPFERNCIIEFRNLGSQPVEVFINELRFGPWQWDDRSMHFHGTWRQWTRLQTRTNEGATYGAFDVNYVEARGRGVYVGDTLTLFNGARAWWGEGDEKIYVDGEAFPSHFGTGTEDYYGYAWSNPNFFEAPFHAQPYGKGANSTDMAVNSRYRALDAIPFTSGIRFDMELWHWAKTRVNFAPTTFWYARPGATCNVDPDPESAALAVARVRSDVVEVFRMPGAIEGESLPIVAKSAGTTEVQELFDEPRWSDDQHLWWRDGRPGDTLELRVPVEAEGRCRVTAGLTMANDYAVVQLAVNGEDVGEPFDGYHATVTRVEVDLGVVALRSGDNLLRVTITGRNDKAHPRYMFGLDYLRLEPVTPE